MVTKYVCMMGGCDFVTEDTVEAKEHGEEHDVGENPHHMATVSYSEDEGTSCETFHTY